MADRMVTATGKKDGEITRLCKAGESWSPRLKADAIADIETKVHSYYVIWPPGNRRTEIRVVSAPTGRYLRTDHDNTTRNNLLDLPDC